MSLQAPRVPLHFFPFAPSGLLNSCPPPSVGQEIGRRAGGQLARTQAGWNWSSLSHRWPLSYSVLLPAASHGRATLCPAWDTWTQNPYGQSWKASFHKALGASSAPAHSQHPLGPSRDFQLAPPLLLSPLQSGPHLLPQQFLSLCQGPSVLTESHGKFPTSKTHHGFLFFPTRQVRSHRTGFRPQTQTSPGRRGLFQPQESALAPGGSRREKALPAGGQGKLPGGGNFLRWVLKDGGAGVGQEALGQVS